jgi:energy-coupling factor transport system ATP-binding protein
VLDEPAAGLDPRGRREILGGLSKYVKESGITLILVSHSMEDMAYYCDNVVVMNGAQVFASGTVSEIFARADELESIGLDIPVISKIAIRLIERGVALNGELYTVSGVKAAVKKLIGGGKE